MRIILLGKPQRTLCILLICCIAALFIIEIWGKDRSVSQWTKEESYTVTERFYGVNAEEMERIASIPLEDALSGIRGLKRISSSSENGRTRVICYFEGKEQGRYEAVREAAQHVYESLPRSAQRPEIISSGDSRVPFFTAALVAGKKPMPENAGAILEKSVKPALEGLPGVGNVEIFGTGLREIVITLKTPETAARRIDASDIVSILSSNDVLLPGGSFTGEREIPIMVDGRYGISLYTGTGANYIEDLRKALIPVETSRNEVHFVQLDDIADITESERDYESCSRLDGEKTVLIAVMSSEKTDPGNLSVRIKEELLKFPELEFTILSDRGEAERKARSSVLGAAFQGTLMVALLCALLCSGKSNFSLISSLTVPVTVFFASAVLVLLGFSLDKFILAGLSAGVGVAVDAAILSAEYFRSCKTLEEGKAAMRALRFPLVSGILTTVIALLPLIARKGSSLNAVAWAIASVNMVVMVLALTLLPPLFLWNCSKDCNNYQKKKIINLKCIKSVIPYLKYINFKSVLCNKMFRLYRRKIAVIVRLVQKKPLFVMGCWFLLSVLGIFALAVNGADVAEEGSEDSIYAQVEFEGGLHVEESDKNLAVYGMEIKKYPGIKNVQTVARTGTGSVLVGFDPLLTDNKTVRNLMRNTQVQGGFVYILESSPNERSWRVRISGDEIYRCRELASEAGRLCSFLPVVSETVLNFKEGSPRINLKPLRERIAINALSFGSIGRNVRYAVHGPVAYKHITEKGETDVRIRSGGPISREEIQRILIKGRRSALELGSLVSSESLREAGSIQREDRRRSASISIRTGVMDPRRVRDQIMTALSTLELPPGYSVEFDREALKAAEAVSLEGYYFILALLFCYMVIASLKESFSFPLSLLAVVPSSLSVPALCMVLRHFPINEVSAAAFVAVSGVAINAAAIVADALESTRKDAASYYGIFRRRLPILGATTLTTVAAAVPFLFVKNNAAVVKTLSMVSALGVAVSALCAITLIPAMVKVFPGLLGSRVHGG